MPGRVVHGDPVDGEDIVRQADVTHGVVKTLDELLEALATTPSKGGAGYGRMFRRRGADLFTFSLPEPGGGLDFDTIWDLRSGEDRLRVANDLLAAPGPRRRSLAPGSPMQYTSCVDIRVIILRRTGWADRSGSRDRS